VNVETKYRGNENCRARRPAVRSYARSPTASASTLSTPMTTSCAVATTTTTTTTKA
ncbi:unnamed protein product, partial [Ceratitis capitata]